MEDKDYLHLYLGCKMLRTDCNKIFTNTNIYINNSTSVEGINIGVLYSKYISNIEKYIININTSNTNNILSFNITTSSPIK